MEVESRRFSMMPKIAIIYLTYNTKDSAEDIPECLRSIEVAEYPKDRMMIVFVENKSKHGQSRSMIERDWFPKAGVTMPEMEYISNVDDVGYAGATGVGLVAARTWGADYVYLLNQDTVVDPNFLWRIVQYAESHSNAAIMQSRLMLKQSPDECNSQGNALHYLGFGFSIGYGEKYIPNETAKLPMFYASGAAVLIRISAIDLIGFFEPSYYMYHEDVDLSWRARLAGFDIAYVEDSVVFHHYEFSRSISKFFWMERNRHLTNLVNYEWKTLLVIAPMTLIMELGTMIFAIKSGWWKEKLRSWIYFFKPSTWQFICTRRAKVASFRKVRDAELLPMLCGVITNQDIENPMLTYVVNPVLNAYFGLIKRIL
jgi:GT2 family glycosyltransferase